MKYVIYTSSIPEISRLLIKYPLEPTKLRTNLHQRRMKLRLPLAR